MYIYIYIYIYIYSITYITIQIIIKMSSFYDGNSYWVMPRRLVFVFVISRGAMSQ